MKFKYGLVSLGMGLMLASGTANAIPELRETRGDYDHEMVTIYPDHADPNVFYFLPNSSSFALHNDGMPAVGLTHWGLTSGDPQDGGGILSFVLQASLSDRIKGELTKFKAAHPGARLTVVPFGASYVAGPNAENWKALISSIELPAHAGVAETEVGVNMLLTEPGARAFKALISGANTPFNVQLCFDIYGAMPAMDAEVNIHYDKVYEHFAAQGGGNYWFYSWSVRAEVEKLIENGQISIRILGGDAKFEDYVTSLTDEMIHTYMKPSLANTPTAAGKGSFSFNYTHKEERKEVKIRVSKKIFVTDSRCLPLAFKDLKPWAGKLITSAD